MSKAKRRQHHVWKNYLKPWIIDGKIWCKSSEKIFNTNPDNIGISSCFYEVEPINESEYNFIDGYIKQIHPSTYLMHKGTLDMYFSFSKLNEVARINAIEDYHNLIENTSKKYLNMLYEKDLSFFDETQGKIDFSQYLGFQYMRTSKIRSALEKSHELSLSNTKISSLINIKNVCKILSLLLGNIVGNWVYSKSKLFLLHNETELDLITGDQPIYNLKAPVDSRNKKFTEFELYYPLSPQSALIISNNNCNISLNNIDTINKLNSFIVTISEKQIFSKKKETLERYA